MTTLIYALRADAILFVVASVAVMLTVELWLRRTRGRTSIGWKAWMILAFVVGTGVWLAEVAGSNEVHRLRAALEGIAPTYASELSRLGHHSLPDPPAADDPAYLALVQTEVRWLAVNAMVADIYTLRRRADGTVVSVVDSETDADGDGLYEGARESRVLPGSPYREETPQLASAFSGRRVFDDVPRTDRYGTWVSAFEPMFGPDGRVEAVLGVDYPAADWVGAVWWRRGGTLGFAFIVVLILVTASHLVGVMRAEIRGRATTEIALRKSEARLRTILDNEPECVVVLSPEGLILEINPAGRAMLECHEGNPIGAAFVDFVHPQDRAEWRTFHDRVGRGERAALRFRMVGQQGGVRWVETNAVRVATGDDSGGTVLAVARDISRRHAAEEEAERLQKQLVLASRQAGMAEVATGVLHNVGNVLNSVNVSAHVVSGKIQKLRLGNLAKAVSMLSGRAADLATFLDQDERGRRLPAYLRELSDHLVDEQRATLAELKTLVAGLVHIKEIVQAQQTLAKGGTMLESVRAAELMEDALRVNLFSVTRHRVEVVRHYEDAGPLLLDRNKILQILVNLVANAKNAIKANPEVAGKLEVSVRMATTTSGNTVRFEVADNGVGIPRENLTRIFSHGFTTRDGGHGFGLHSSSNAAREMNGTLIAESAGEGSGARFILELPARVPAKAAS